MITPGGRSQLFLQSVKCLKLFAEFINQQPLKVSITIVFKEYHVAKINTFEKIGPEKTKFVLGSLWEEQNWVSVSECS